MLVWRSQDPSARRACGHAEDLRGSSRSSYNRRRTLAAHPTSISGYGFGCVSEPILGRTQGEFSNVLHLRLHLRRREQRQHIVASMRGRLLFDSLNLINQVTRRVRGMVRANGLFIRTTEQSLQPARLRRTPPPAITLQDRLSVRDEDRTRCSRIAERVEVDNSSTVSRFNYAADSKGNWTAMKEHDRRHDYIISVTSTSRITMKLYLFH